MHPARQMPFDELLEGLEKARAAGNVLSRECPAGRRLYIYTNRCVYENGWDDFSLLARGLILHPPTKKIIATPFPKFFNAGERGAAIPALPFEVFEKVDGSLGILHHFDGAWRASTKGAFESPQARWIEGRLAEYDLTALVPGTTYLVEAVYPENRIVVRYDKTELVLLAAYREDGIEMNVRELAEVATRLEWRAANRHAFASFVDLVEYARTLPKTEEGFVIRFSDGLRLKVKGSEYQRIHALISRCTPLAMWEAMSASADLDAIRRDIPEEFWGDFDSIRSALTARIDGIMAKVAATAERLATATDKEIGLQLKSLDAEVQPFIFVWRKTHGKIDDRARAALFRMIRPTNNELAGYVPSYAMRRVAEEMS
jgi:RNA ligase